MRIAERIVRTVLENRGIEVNGPNPWDPEIHHPDFYRRVLVEGSLGLGRSYRERWWDCRELDQYFARLLAPGLPLIARFNPISMAKFLKSKIINQAPRRNAFVVGRKHYDLGNNFYRVMLGPSWTYSCGYLEGLPHSPDFLGAGQLAKNDLFCRKAGLDKKRGLRVLDIGCGWGSLARHAATRYGAHVVGLTVSKEQAVLAQARNQGLPVDIRLQDYRDLNPNEMFDVVLSVGMFEHVGSKNHRTYMEIVKRHLKPGGIFALHTIGSPQRFFSSSDEFISEEIFPGGGETPIRRQIRRSSDGLFEIRDWHEFGKYYDPTLMAWYSNFVAGWNELKTEYGRLDNGQFFRKWKYYLLSCAGSFRVGHAELWQIVFARPGEHQGYAPVR